MPCTRESPCGGALFADDGFNLDMKRWGLPQRRFACLVGHSIYDPPPPLQLAQPAVRLPGDGKGRARKGGANRSDVCDDPASATHQGPGEDSAGVVSRVLRSDDRQKGAGVVCGGSRGRASACSSCTQASHPVAPPALVVTRLLERRPAEFAPRPRPLRSRHHGGAGEAAEGAMTPLEAALLLVNFMGLLQALQNPPPAPPETITNPAPIIEQAERACEQAR